MLHPETEGVLHGYDDEAQANRHRAIPSAERAERSPAAGVSPGRAPRGAHSVASLLHLQRAAGNAGVAQMLADVVQRDTPSDQGGRADVTNTEQDMRAMLGQWQWAAGQGISQFVTNSLSGRLDSIESGDWKSFITGLLGNTIWAATAFTPIGWAKSAVFAISMAGIAVASPSIPSRSKSAIPALQQQMIDYINAVYDQLDKQLRSKAEALLKQKPGISRYQALAEFATASFDPLVVTVDTTYRTIPQLDKSMIRSQFVGAAQERLDTSLALGQLKNNRRDLLDVVWILGRYGGEKRLALMEHTMDEPKFRYWISKDKEQEAIAQWRSRSGTTMEPETRKADDFDDL